MRYILNVIARFRFEIGHCENRFETGLENKNASYVRFLITNMQNCKNAINWFMITYIDFWRYKITSHFTPIVTQ